MFGDDLSMDQSLIHDDGFNQGYQSTREGLGNHVNEPPAFPSALIALVKSMQIPQIELEGFWLALQGFPNNRELVDQSLISGSDLDV